MNSERIDGPTPAGGTYCVAYFFDAAHHSVPRSKATGAEVIEYNAQGEQIARTYAEFPKSQSFEVARSAGRGQPTAQRDVASEAK